MCDAPTVEYTETAYRKISAAAITVENTPWRFNPSHLQSIYEKIKTHISTNKGVYSTSNSYFVYRCKHDGSGEKISSNGYIAQLEGGGNFKNCIVSVRVRV